MLEPEMSSPQSRVKRSWANRASLCHPSIFFELPFIAFVVEKGKYRYRDTANYSSLRGAVANQKGPGQSCQEQTCLSVEIVVPLNGNESYFVASFERMRRVNRAVIKIKLTIKHYGPISHSHNSLITAYSKPKPEISILSSGIGLQFAWAYMGLESETRCLEQEHTIIMSDHTSITITESQCSQILSQGDHPIKSVRCSHPRRVPNCP